MADELDDSWLDVPDEAEDGETLQITEEGGKTKEELSKYALKHDRWSKRKGKDLIKEEAFEDLTEEEAADTFSMGFDYEPEILEQCADEDQRRFFKALEEDPDYRALHALTLLDTLASETAAAHFAKQLKAYKAKRDEEKQKQEEEHPGEQPGPLTPQQELKQEMEAMAAAARAATAAAQDVKSLKDLEEGMGLGSGDGAQNSKMNPQEVRKQFNKLRNNQELREIFEWVGRYKNVARAKQRSKVIRGYDEIVGVELDNDPVRLLPIEIAMLAHPVLRLDAYRRFAERALLCRKLQGIAKVAKGPFIVSWDESGSMRGKKIVQTKAIGMTMAWVARQQRRWCGLHAWATGAQSRILALPPANWPTPQVMDFLEEFIDGSSTRLPIKLLPQVYEQLGAQKGKTDIIIITDGISEKLAVGEIEAFKKWKLTVEARVIGISIEADCDVMKEFSDEYYHIQALGVNNEAVEGILSI